MVDDGELFAAREEGRGSKNISQVGRRTTTHSTELRGV